MIAKHGLPNVISQSALSKVAVPVPVKVKVAEVLRDTEPLAVGEALALVDEVMLVLALADAERLALALALRLIETVAL